MNTPIVDHAATQAATHAATTPGHGASHACTVDRALTHRRAVAEVFVTSLERVPADIPTADADVFVVGAQLPRMHAYYGDHTGAARYRHDPLLVMEAARQAAIAVTHRFFDVPTDRAFLVRRFDVVSAPTPAWLVTPEPTDLTLTVHIPRRHLSPDGTPTGFDMVLDIDGRDAPLATVSGSFSWAPPSAWTRLRAAHRAAVGLDGTGAVHDPGAPAPPGEVGRVDTRNVVLGGLERTGDRVRSGLVVDLTHPFLFDHALDHVPGTLLLEAARQAARTLLDPAAPHPIAVRSTFARFVEFDLPTAIVVDATGTTLTARITQADAECARIDVEFPADVPAGGRP